MTVDMPTNHHNHDKNWNQTLFIMTIIQRHKYQLFNHWKKETKHSLAHLRVFITYSFKTSSYGSMLVLVLGSPNSPLFLGGDWAGTPGALTSGPPWCCFNVAFSRASCRYAFPMTSSSSKAWSNSVLVWDKLIKVGLSLWFSFPSGAVMLQVD